MKAQLNIPLLRKIQKAILKHHKQFQMHWWFSRENSVRASAGGCGTAACIAGWAVHLNRKGKRVDKTSALIDIHNVQAEAAKLIGLASREEQESLFGEGYWPEHFRIKWDNAKTTQAKAKVAASRIEHLIKKGE